MAARLFLEQYFLSFLLKSRSVTELCQLGTWAEGRFAAKNIFQSIQLAFHLLFQPIIVRFTSAVHQVLPSPPCFQTILIKAITYMIKVVKF